MQKGVIAIILCLAIILGVMMIAEQNNQYDDAIRIHIRANSNSEADQNLKYALRDDLLVFLTPLLSEAKTKKQAKKLIKSSIGEIKEIAEANILKKGFDYGVSCLITKEDFPLRSYQGITFQSGEYEALIINIGSGQGDNWWCVAFPPLCFVPDEGSNEIVYKSKIMEIINDYKEKKSEDD